jgi:hypothetical protein
MVLLPTPRIHYGPPNTKNSLRSSSQHLGLIMVLLSTPRIHHLQQSTENMSENIPHTQIHCRDFNFLQLTCGHAGCNQFFKTGAGRTKHILSAHPVISSPPPEQDMDINMPDVLLQELENWYNGEDFPPYLMTRNSIMGTVTITMLTCRGLPPHLMSILSFLGMETIFFATITRNSMVCLISLINSAADMTYRTSM